MNEQEAAKFATRIKREAWHQVKVKRGKTNGAHTFHIYDTQAKDRRLASTTIYTLGEWLVHPLNKLNKPQAKREQTLDEYIEKYTQETAGIQVGMNRLNEAALTLAARFADFQVAYRKGA